MLKKLLARSKGIFKSKLEVKNKATPSAQAHSENNDEDNLQMLFSSTYRSDFNIKKDDQKALIPTIFDDFIKYFYVYFLLALLVFLCLYKVYQVQQTRYVTASLNELSKQSQQLDSQWLILLGQREQLTEPNLIRKQAREKLNMLAPKTDLEKVITIE